jgi:hypothetical protein
MTTTGEMFEDTYEQEGMTQEEILMNENDLLQGLLDLAKTKNDDSLYRRVEVKRDGTVYISFRIHPLSEEELNNCVKNATKYAKQKKYGDPKIAIETNYVKMRSLKIYTATVAEDRAKLWDNKEALNRLNFLQGVDMIESLLLAGEKDKLCDAIDEISGLDYELEEQAKN